MDRKIMPRNPGLRIVAFGASREFRDSMDRMGGDSGVTVSLVESADRLRQAIKGGTFDILLAEEGVEEGAVASQMRRYRARNPQIVTLLVSSDPPPADHLRNGSGSTAASCSPVPLFAAAC